MITHTQTFPPAAQRPEDLTARYSFRDIIAVSPEMLRQVENARKCSCTASNVLITGETGTGKELFAHSIHAASSRQHQPFVVLNCATLPEDLLERELFGWVPESGPAQPGRFALANHGTLFLDEIGEIPAPLQAKLLRVLEEQEICPLGGYTAIPVDVRVLAATNVNLQEQVERGRFRRDLLYRLNPLELDIPPLRQRPEDVLPLMEGFLGLLGAELGKPPFRLTEQAQAMLLGYDWPGNVLELRNICERLVVLSESPVIDGEALRELQVFPHPAAPEPIPDQIPVTHHPKTKTELARELGISRTTLWRISKRQKALEQAQSMGK